MVFREREQKAYQLIIHCEQFDCILKIKHVWIHSKRISSLYRNVIVENAFYYRIKRPNRRFRQNTAHIEIGPIVISDLISHLNIKYQPQGIDLL